MELGRAVETETNLAGILHRAKMLQQKMREEKKAAKNPQKAAGIPDWDSGRMVDPLSLEGQELRFEYFEKAFEEGAEESLAKGGPPAGETAGSEKGKKETARSKKKKEARAGVEAVMRAFFPEDGDVQMTKSG